MISVVLATHNEEKNLEKCLNSVKSFADEIIIADGASTDKTVEIAKKFGAHIIPTTNKANFHINKQMAMDVAKGDLILQIDADEVVDNELAAFIKSMPLHGLSAQTSAWWVKRKNYFMGRFLKKGGQYPDPVIRLYRQGKARLPQRDVHEQMIVDGKIGWAHGHLLHYSNPTFADYMYKFNRYTSFKAQQLFDEQVHVSIGNTFLYLLWKPFATFFSLYIRHGAFLTDGVPGFVFAFLSGLHHSVAYLKLWEMYERRA